MKSWRSVLFFAGLLAIVVVGTVVVGATASVTKVDLALLVLGSIVGISLITSPNRASVLVGAILTTLVPTLGLMALGAVEMSIVLLVFMVVIFALTLRQKDVTITRLLELAAAGCMVWSIYRGWPWVISAVVWCVVCGAVYIISLAGTEMSDIR